MLGPIRYTQELASYCAELATIAYEQDPSKILGEEAFCYAGRILDDECDKSNPTMDNVKGYVAYTPEKNWMVVAFRGTANVNDWIADMDSAQISQGAGVTVHAGFDGEYQSCYLSMFSLIDKVKLQCPNIRIFLIGHSLGGAMATLAAHDLANLNYDIAAVVTYGSPRVYNHIGAKVYNTALADRTYRLTNNNDIVPHLPTWWMGYRHIGTRVKVEAPTTGKSLWLKIREYLFGTVEDHLLVNYERALAPPLSPIGR